MAKTLVGALALAALPSALAFRNTSPFFLFSTANLRLENSQDIIADSSSITATVLDALKDCPTRNYIIVDQPGVSSADYVDGLSVPRLSRYMSRRHSDIKTTVSMPEVVGQIDREAIIESLQSRCAPKAGDKDERPFITEQKHSTPSFTSKELRQSVLNSHDEKLELAINASPRPQSYTVIYITSPPTAAESRTYHAEPHYKYEPEEESLGGGSVQMELKRDLSSHVQRANATEEGGLFERYQYFTPGLFMGFAAIIPLFLILLVGVRALTSLEVSYFAFSKEMGPNAQKKQ